MHVCEVSGGGKGKEMGRDLIFYMMKSTQKHIKLETHLAGYKSFLSPRMKLSLQVELQNVF